MHSQALPTFICSDIVLVTYVIPGPSFLKMPTVHSFYLKLANNNHIGILDYEYLAIDSGEYVCTNSLQLNVSQRSSDVV